ncbi:MAG: hypothetical protein HC852_19195 [Acaryochloridaceae cyanobacterium RU_4_10]|nr:hypothetical protein [Acaryochloridaceae cyanobacterium RU_4_10]
MVFAVWCDGYLGCDDATFTRCLLAIRSAAIYSSLSMSGYYALTGLTSPGHYLYEGAQSMTVKMTALIWSDAIAGLLVVGFLVWSGLIRREWQQNPSIEGQN